MKNILNKSVVLMLVAVFLAAIHINARAAGMVWANKPFTFKATDAGDIRDLLKDLMGRQGVVTVLSEQVRGRMARGGTFQPRTLFEQIVQEFSLLPYFDGSVLYIYSSQEAITRSFVVNPQLVGRLVSSLAQMNMLDSRNTVRGSDRDGIVFVSGAPRFVAEVEEVVRASQQQAFASPPVFRFFPLKYAWAHDVTISHNNKDIVVPGVASTLRRLVNPAYVRPAVLLDDGMRDTGGPEPKLKGQGLRGDGDRRADPVATYGADTGGNAPPPLGRPLPGRATLPDLTRPAVPVDAPAIEADRRSNGIIVRDSVERLPYYEEIIRALDVEPVQIEIQAMIIDIDINKLDQLGVGWNWRNVKLGDGRTDFFPGGTLGPGNPVIGSNTEFGTRRNGAGSLLGGGLSLNSILGDRANFLLRINALAEDGVAKVVSRPQVVTLANVEAVLEELQTAYIKVAGAYEVDLYRVTAGTTLKVVPHPIQEGDKSKIRLFVTIDDGRISSTGANTADDGKNVPFVERAALNTQALLFDGESLLLGGLVRERTDRGVSKIPLLGDIPYLGNLFKFQTNTNERKERLFLIAPRIVPANRVAQTDGVFIQKPSVPAVLEGIQVQEPKKD